MQVRSKKDEIIEQNEKFANEQYLKLMHRLTSYRMRMDITLADLAVKTQTYPSYIHRVEKGQINTTVKKLMVILDAMGLELSIHPKKDVEFEEVVKSLKDSNRTG